MKQNTTNKVLAYGTIFHETLEDEPYEDWAVVTLSFNKSWVAAKGIIKSGRYTSWMENIKEWQPLLNNKE